MNKLIYIIFIGFLFLSCNNILDKDKSKGDFHHLKFNVSQETNPNIALTYVKDDWKHSVSTYKILSISSTGKVNWTHSFEGWSEDDSFGISTDYDKSGNLLVSEFDSVNPAQFTLMSPSGSLLWRFKEEKRNYIDAIISTNYSFIGMNGDNITILHSAEVLYAIDDNENDYYTKFHQLNTSGELLVTHQYHRDGTLKMAQSTDGQHLFLAVDNYSNNGFWIEDDESEVNNGVLIQKLNMNLNSLWTVNMSTARLNGNDIMPYLMKSNNEGGILTVFKYSTDACFFQIDETGEITAETILYYYDVENIQLEFSSENALLISNGQSLKNFDQSLNETWVYETDGSDAKLGVTANDDIFLVSDNNLVKLSTNGEVVFILSLNNGFQTLDGQEALNVRVNKFEIGGDNNLYLLLGKTTTINGKLKSERILQKRSSDGDILWNRVIVLK